MAEGGVASFSFQESLVDGQTVHFNVLRLKKSFLLWIGTESKMNNLSVAMKTHLSGSDVVASQLFGPSNDVMSTSMAQRFAKRTGCQCFLSVNISDINMLQEIESIILAKLQSDPNLFYFQ